MFYWRKQWKKCISDIISDMDLTSSLDFKEALSYINDAFKIFLHKYVAFWNVLEE